MAVDLPAPVGLSSSRTAVTSAIREAAQATGASFDYLLATAKVESSLNPNLTVRSSSATGLFQFIEQTWLATLKQGGAAFGYGRYANAITRTPSGRYVVDDPSLRNEIMRMRTDPTANARMGGVVTRLNAAQLAKRLGRAPSEGELYVAHFFGPYAGAKAIKLAANDPTANAAAIFPAAAAANQPIFYDKQGNARSIAGVCAELMRRYQVARGSAPGSPMQLAGAATPLRPPAPIPSAGVAQAAPSFSRPMATALNERAFLPPSPATATAFVNDPAAVTSAYAAAQPARPPVTEPATGQPPAGSVFRSLFHDDGRRAGVAPVVAELWGASTTTTSPVDRPASGGGSLLDLFRDLPADERRPPAGEA